MGFFFLLAGYFTPASLERKGYAKFHRRPLSPLGLPLLAFIFILGPLTAAMVRSRRQRILAAFPVSLEPHDHHQRSALVRAGAADVQPRLLRLARSIRLAVSPNPRARQPKFPLMLVAAQRHRRRRYQLSPSVNSFQPAVNIFGLQLGYFAPYIFLFAIGIAAWRYDWLRQLTVEACRPWIIALIVAWPIMPIGIIVAKQRLRPRQSKLRRRPHMARRFVCLLGAIRCVGTDRRMAAVLRAHT